MNYLLALGSNLHKENQTPFDLLSHAIWHLEGVGVTVRRQSAFYRSPAQPAGCAPPS